MPEPGFSAQLSGGAIYDWSRSVSYGGLECGWSQFLKCDAQWDRHLKRFKCLLADQGGPLLL